MFRTRRGGPGRQDKPSWQPTPREATHKCSRPVCCTNCRKKTTQKKVARKMTGLVCPKLSGAFETARVAVVIEVRTDCFWRTSRRKNKKIQNSQAWKGNQQIQRHKQLDFVDSFTSIFAGKFSPRFTRGGEKKKKKEIKCLRRSNYLLQFVPRGCQSGITADILWRSTL